MDKLILYQILPLSLRNGARKERNEKLTEFALLPALNYPSSWKVIKFLVQHKRRKRPKESGNTVIEARKRRDSKKEKFRRHLQRLYEIAGR